MFDTRTTGQLLDSYSAQRPLTDVENFFDAYLLPLPLEITVTTTGLFCRGVTVGELNGSLLIPTRSLTRVGSQR